MAIPALLPIENHARSLAWNGYPYETGIDVDLIQTVLAPRFLSPTGRLNTPSWAGAAESAYSWMAAGGDVANRGIQFYGDQTALGWRDRADGTWRRLWDSGSFTPSSKADLAGADFTGPVTINDPAKHWTASPVLTSHRTLTGGANGITRLSDVAVFTDDAPDVTGTIKITLPVGWTRTMMRLRISGYNYNSNGAWTLDLGGYNATATIWQNTSATIAGPVPFTSVRFGIDGNGKCCILLGTTATIWQYPKIVIDDVILSFFGISATWTSGWTITRITDETGIVVSATPTMNAPVMADSAGVATAPHFKTSGGTTGGTFRSDYTGGTNFRGNWGASNYWGIGAGTGRAVKISESDSNGVWVASPADFDLYLGARRVFHEGNFSITNPSCFKGNVFQVTTDIPASDSRAKLTIPIAGGGDEAAFGSAGTAYVPGVPQLSWVAGSTYIYTSQRFRVGSTSGYVEANAGNLFTNHVSLRDSSIERWTADVDGAALYINYAGYNGGMTRFRDLSICDGKGVEAIRVAGATKRVTFIGDAQSYGNIGTIRTGDTNLRVSLGATGIDFGTGAATQDTTLARDIAGHLKIGSNRIWHAGNFNPNSLGTPGITGLANARHTINTSNGYMLPIPLAYHDWAMWTTPTEETYNGTVWSAAALSKNLFAGREDIYYTAITTSGGIQGRRWTWTGCSWNDAEWIALNIGYTSPTPSVTITVEQSTDGAAWTPVHSSTGVPSRTVNFLKIPPCDANSYMRLSMVVASGTGDISLNAIKILTHRPGAQGKGNYNHMPFSWDADRNIALPGRLNASGAIWAPELSVLASGGNDAFRALVPGDTQCRYTVTTDGLIKWGTGSVAPDTTLSRLSAGELQIGSNKVWHAGNFNPTSKLDTTATAANSSKLGGVAASGYALLSGATFTGTTTVAASAGLRIALSTDANAFCDIKAYSWDATNVGSSIRVLKNGVMTASVYFNPDATTDFVGSIATRGALRTGYTGSSGGVIFYSDTNVQKWSNGIPNQAGAQDYVIYDAVRSVTAMKLLGATGNAEFVADVKATTFTGAGTNLTGSAASLLAGGIVNGTSRQGAATLDPLLPKTSYVHSTLGSPTIGQIAMLPGTYTRNRTQFMSASSIEYTTDGTNWLAHPDAGTDAANSNLFLGGASALGNLLIKAPSNGNWKAIRLTLANPGGYCYLDALYFYASTQGHTGMTVKIEKSVGTSSANWATVVDDTSSGSFSGWPGHGMVTHPTITWDSTSESQSKYVRITLTPSWHATLYQTSDMVVYAINWIGTYPGTGQKEIYNWDKNRNVTFPAELGAVALRPTGQSSTGGTVNKSASLGLMLWGVAGSQDDFSILTPGGAYLARVRTGTTVFEATNLKSAGTFTTVGTVDLGATANTGTINIGGASSVITLGALPAVSGSKLMSVATYKPALRFNYVELSTSDVQPPMRLGGWGKITKILRRRENDTYPSVDGSVTIRKNYSTIIAVVTISATDAHKTWITAATPSVDYVDGDTITCECTDAGTGCNDINLHIELTPGT